MNDIEDRIKRAEPGMVYPLWLSNVEEKNGVIRGVNLRNGESVHLCQSNEPAILAQLNAYSEKLESIEQPEKAFLKGGLMGQLGDIIGKFEYEYLCKIEEY